MSDACDHILLVTMTTSGGWLVPPSDSTVVFCLGAIVDTDRGALVALISSKPQERDKTQSKRSQMSTRGSLSPWILSPT